MTNKELIIQSLENTPSSILDEVLDFICYLKTKQAQETLELAEDLSDLRVIREEIKHEGTIPWAQVKQEIGLT